MVFSVDAGFGPNELPALQLRWACRVYQKAQEMMPHYLLEMIELDAWDETHDPIEFVLEFEAVLEHNLPTRYNEIIDALI